MGARATQEKIDSARFSLQVLRGFYRFVSIADKCVESECFRL